MANRPMDLEALKKVFQDQRLHVAIGKITQLSLASDRSSLKCLVSLFPEAREIVCRMSWEAVGPESGIFAFPAVEDLVLVAFAEGDFNQAFVIRRLTSRDDKIPSHAADGDTVIKTQKKAWMTAQKILLSKGDQEPTEPLVLGNVLQELLSGILEQLSTLSQTLASHTHIATSPGAATTVPVQAASFSASKSEFDSMKSEPVDNGDILSGVAFTEKGALV